jgi:primosomal protein N' (replication factor Y)
LRHDGAIVPAIAQVEPLTTSRSLRGPFDYRLPSPLSGAVSVGTVLLVPFGRRDVVGVVVGLSDSSDVADERLLEPRRAFELGIGPELVALADWVAAEYCSTRARALRLVLPPGPAGAGAGSVRLFAQLTEAGALALHNGARLTELQRELLARLRAAGTLPATAVGADHAALRRLEARGLIALEPRALARRPESVAVGARREAPLVLAAAQRDALHAIVAAIDAGAAERYLLHGVTGSGKTEVYLRAAAAALERERGVLVLVPEIALTPQTVSRFVERFGDTVAVLHSRLSDGERRDEWSRLRSGEARVCVGPRSAVFAPIDRLGLIVVDEEHDSSYKHEGDPRYDARHVAERRALDAGAVLLAGSATPRPESHRRLRRLSMPARADGSPLPAVELLDMRAARHALHPDTVEALAQLRRERGKAIVLLNRRGWSNFVSCRACGYVWQCPECDVALVLHRIDGYLACHHCGHRAAVPDVCGVCGSQSVARHGIGTERLEHELGEALGDPGFPIFRLDADVAEGRGRAAAILSAFERAPTGILMGTQMVAKGHDFDGVMLGVVLDADATLRFPDFRAEERTFALVAQLAGRTGRGPADSRRDRRGRVLVQTLAPDAPCLAFAARHDSDGFLAEELARREALRYPPYGNLIRIVCSSVAPGAALAAAGAVREQLAVPRAIALGPAPLFRLRGRERAQVVVKASDRETAIAGVGATVAAVAAERRHSDAAFSVDVDPQ